MATVREAKTPLDMLRAKAMLLLRREREVFELRQERSRIEIWLNVFHKLSLDLQSKKSDDLLGEWATSMVNELGFQIAASYAVDPDPEHAELVSGHAHAPLPSELALDAETFAFLASNKSGRYLGGAPAALGRLTQAARLDAFFWSLVSIRGRRLVLLAGFALGAAKFHSLSDYDFSHFLLFANHLAAVVDNLALIAELDRERSELSASNAELDKSLRNLREAQSKVLQSTQVLAQVSRRAGMAEIATGVLHNVGNVLNSVNVSAEVASERLRTMKLAGVARVANLLEENAGDLAAFFATDDRGRKITAYLRELGGHLSGEAAAVSSELTSLQQHIEHIKSIVSKQQAYARTAGVHEACVASKLMDDALGLTEDSLAHIGADVVRDYGDVPEIVVDRHKVLQILVNLMNNAKHALGASQGGPRTMTAFLRTAGDRVQMGVRDNGVGIAREHADKLFTHGFTTKAHGHGFGLHTSALSAKEMGGALTWSSGGPGLGATFVLELPTRLPMTSLPAPA